MADDTTLDEDGAEELAVVVPTFTGESEEGEEDHCTKYRRPATDLSGDVKGGILNPDYLRDEVDTTEV